MQPDQRLFVPFQALWEMAIDVPYSFLVRDGPLAWSCGQLALDTRSRVIAPGDLVRQSEVVRDHIIEILSRGGLSTGDVRRLLLYHIRDDEPAWTRMLEIFRSEFGHDVLVDAIAVPHFYYDGIMLEADVFCDAAAAHRTCHRSDGARVAVLAGEHRARMSVVCTPLALAGLATLLADALTAHGVTAAHLISEHWFGPASALPALARTLAPRGFAADPGTLVKSGSGLDAIHALLLFSSTAAVQRAMGTRAHGDTAVHTRCAGDRVWLQARSKQGSLGLLDQTRAIMNAIDHTLRGLDLGFHDVVKSTTHYLGGSTAAELHENMTIRNHYYARPGPASTGVPVSGFLDPASRIAVDVTALRRGV